MAGLTKIKSGGIGDNCDFDGEGTLVLDSTNNRVGIGTSSPTAELHVNTSTDVTLKLDGGTGLGDGAGIRFERGSSPKGYIGNESWLFGSSNDSDDLCISSAGQKNIGITSTNVIDIGHAGGIRVTAAGDVGIGTTSPSTPLDVNGNVQFGDGGGFDMNINGTRHQFSIGGSEKMRIDSSGRLLVGTTTKGQANADNLTIADGGHCGITIRSGGSDNGAIYFSDGTSGNPEFAGFIEYLHSSDSMRLGTSSGNAVSIDSSRRLLVGTTTTFGTSSRSSFYSKLQVRDNTYGSSTTGRIAIGTSGASGTDTSLGELIFCDSDGGDRALIRGSTTSAGGTDNYPGYLSFLTNGGSANPTERMRITSNGFTKHSNNGSYNDTAGLYHEFVTNQTGAPSALFRAPASYSNENIKSFVLRGAGTEFNHFLADSNGTTVCLIRGNGNLSNSNGAYGQISDIKLKENIVDANSQWDDIKAVRFRKFNFKEETGHETFTQLGVIAQELELTSPGLVDQSPDRDEEGNDLGTVTKSVKYSVLYTKAIKALQEAMGRIETLEAKVAALEAV